MDFRWPPPPDGRPEQPPVSRGPRSGRPTMPTPPTELVATPHGVELEVLDSGSGAPVTVFAHGLGQGITETRPLGSGVIGRKIFPHLRGHGRSGAPGGTWTYADLARDLRAVADLTGATRALGISLGAAALARLVADNPTRFERLVFFLPAVLDKPRPAASRARLEALLAAVEEQDPSAIAEAVTPEIPAPMRGSSASWAYLRQRVDHLMHFGLGAGLASLPDEVPVPDPAVLSAVTVPALVIGARGDDLHPHEVARALADALPQAELHIYDRPGVLWTERADLRERVASFLNA
ncbi:alpha/beta hydrolase [Virgisporangium aliadipatigenens]|uniref:Alpha/beta hydrolase n=1 Tax=Virgisporangium aliadipatigenens TaxID=741659 RepID=A0A8J3YQB3_9ACTN|nr:alpha/beta hydrolase [Virgisporangium aliadipatigenens]GIJ48617.1 alpha/beta hydrolase [Virgisporangium aliadipatigenens]